MKINDKPNLTFNWTNNSVTALKVCLNKVWLITDRVNLNLKSTTAELPNTSTVDGNVCFN